MNSEIDPLLEQIQKNIDEISNLDWNKIKENAPKFGGSSPNKGNLSGLFTK